ncbi:MFS transporter [Streptomyces mirabilis]|uniref:MFS transporter n=1 Tax=Streptomyces mirabilis TaxID=68239 RepID=UPI0036D767D3
MAAHGMMDRVDPMNDTEGRPRTGWGVLTQRDFRLLWVGESVSGLGNSITVVALPLIAVEVLDADSTAVGLLAAAVWLPWLLVGLPVGAWVDRMRKRPLMIACDLVAGAALLSVPAAAARRAHPSAPGRRRADLRHRGSVLQHRLPLVHPDRARRP